MPKISIIIPFHNRFAWLKEAIESVLNQTYQDFELILIDDGSDEDFSHYFPINNQKIRYFRQFNQGQSVARNLGISQATGEYVAFLDSDDIFLPNKLQIQLNFMEKNVDIGLSHTSYYKIDHYSNYQSIFESGEKNPDTYPEIMMVCFIAMSTVMVRKNVLENIKFNKKYIIGEDIIFWITIAQNHRISGINQPLSKIRMHGNNASENINAQLLVYHQIIGEFFLYSNAKLSFFKAQKIKSKIYYTCFLISHRMIEKNFQINIKYLVLSIGTYPFQFRALIWMLQQIGIFINKLRIVILNVITCDNS